MYLLYIDDSGSIQDHKIKHCVLAGFSIYETQTHSVEIAVNRIMQKYLPAYPELEIHGTEIRSGKRMWRSVDEDIRNNIINDILYLIKSAYPKQMILFGAVISKTAAVKKGINIQEALFTQIASRFDMYLKRKYRKRKEHARGIAIFDKCSTESDIQKWTHVFKNTGDFWGNKLVNFSEVPLFLDSKMSRLIQLADIIAYSMFRAYEFNDNSNFSLIRECFDKDGHDEYGLYEDL